MFRKRVLPKRGLEPRSRTWEARMITTYTISDIFWWRKWPILLTNKSPVLLFYKFQTQIHKHSSRPTLQTRTAHTHIHQDPLHINRHNIFSPCSWEIACFHLLCTKPTTTTQPSLQKAHHPVCPLHLHPLHPSLHQKQYNRPKPIWDDVRQYETE